MATLFGSPSSPDLSSTGPGALDPHGLDRLPAEAMAKSCVIAGTRLVFELEWSPTQNRSAPEAEYQRARKLGYNFATMLPDKSLVGLAKAVQPGPGKPHSAVVMLVERFSAGGAEAILISVGNRVAFVGLMDRRPVPGFDRLLSGVDAALALLKEFRDIHSDQDVRIATDLRDISNSEQLQTHTLFELAESGSLVRPLINRALRRTVAVGSVSAIVVLSALGSYLWTQIQERRQAEEAARLARENDPNRVYESDIAPLLAQAGIPGDSVLDQWRSLLNRIPLTREGWALQRFECTQTTRDCIATWTRNYGNFHDFQSRPPAGAIAPQMTAPQGSGDVLASSISTHHPWGERGSALPMPAPPHLVRAELPPLGALTQEWGSRLQDLGLTADGRSGAVSLKSAQLFGPSRVTDLNALQKPVVAMQWRIADDVWSLPALSLPTSAVPESLLVQLTPNQITYTLTGSVYAKGKSY